MNRPAYDDVDGLLAQVRDGDVSAEGRLIELLYQELRSIAARRMRRERPDHTWGASDLLNETLVRLRRDGTLAAASDRAFLLKAAGRAMHQLLIDHHRRHRALVHGGGHRKHPLDVALDHLASVGDIPLVELRDELDRLAAVDERSCMVVHLRFFLGMTPAEVAETMGISLATVERDWRFARGWLRDRLGSGDDL